MIPTKVFWTFFILGIAFCAAASIQNPTGHHKQGQQQCKKHCSQKDKWICSFNGTNYRFFANKCWLDKYNCLNSDEYKLVEKKLCQKAHQEYHKTVVATHHKKMDISEKSDSKCVKCKAGYKPICGYNGETNLLFKNLCHFKRFNCLHETKQFQTTQLSNCPIPLVTKNRNSKKGNNKNVANNAGSQSKEIEKIE